MSTSSLLLLFLSLCGSCYCCCPQTWVQNGSSCYFYNEQRLPWLEANEICRILGSDLADITSAAENTFLTNIVSGNTFVYTWIGINDIETDGKWFSTTTRMPVVYFNWAAGEPNNLQGQKEDCGSIDKTGFWNDHVCDPSLIYPSVCEKPV